MLNRCSPNRSGLTPQGECSNLAVWVTAPVATQQQTASQILLLTRRWEGWPSTASSGFGGKPQSFAPKDQGSCILATPGLGTFLSPLPGPSSSRAMWTHSLLSGLNSYIPGSLPWSLLSHLWNFYSPFHLSFSPEHLSPLTIYFLYLLYLLSVSPPLGCKLDRSKDVCLFVNCCANLIKHCYMNKWMNAWRQSQNIYKAEQASSWHTS